MNKRLWWCSVVLIVASVALAACGGDDGGNEPTAGTGAVAGTGAGVGGASGASGTSGASGMGGAGGTTAQPVPCGTTTCQPLGGGLAGMLPGGLGAAIPPPCCADEAMGICGTMSGGTCMPPPMPDARCPSRMFFGMMIASCCTAGNICGVNASQLGLGCIDPGMFTGMPGMSCDGTTPDAGTDDEDGGV